ncbi:winged helix-turn-helix domain-containing protein [Haloarcula sp. S1AR25-5A]|uniref:Winged helix-turn-helix domain-containing protein n=1 Tax=Haloarcula terrestris TaxID=2950533 RepID=A0AAE4EXT1_9EURY|nr:winged helix-turn-helix domain-containing protein [Haloarcula terrestris]MDS0222038.1 winged helix-turn-helix domain-containing protein [Haloarcula terrestris]
MAEDPSPTEVFALLDDEYARALLAATSHRPMTATELSNDCDMSLSTVYRRLDALEDCGLVAARTRLADDGHHPDVYEAQMDELTVCLTDGTFDVSLAVESTTHEFADALVDLWEGL